MISPLSLRDARSAAEECSAFAEALVEVCGMMAFMDGTDVYVTVEEPTFVARFLLDAETDTEESVSNVDAFVELPDGSCWTLTIFTVDEVRRLLAVWRKTGEVANGSYFWAVDQLIVPEPGIAVMTAAIRELVRSGELTSAGVRCEEPA